MKRCYGQSSEVAFPHGMHVYNSSSQRASVIYRWCLKLVESDKIYSELQVFRNGEKEYQIKESEYEKLLLPLISLIHSL